MLNIYPSSETKFTDNGLKVLNPLKAVIRKEDNGEYYIDLKDTLVDKNGIENLEFYQAGNIVVTSTPWGKQRFRLTNPSIENNKIIVRGNHVFFDSANYIIQDSYVVDKNCNDALDHLNSATDVASPFNTISDIDSIYSYRCVRKSLQEAVSDVIERWGGHLVRDNYSIGVRQEIGQDRGVVLAYGKNIVSIKSQENWDEVVTKLMPVGKDGLILPEVWLSLDEVLYDIPFTKVVSFEQNEIDRENYTDGEGNIDEAAYLADLEADLRTKGLNFLNENSAPKVNYSSNAYLKNVSDVGDKIYVKHPKCRIDLETRVLALEYDVISDKITKVEFGNFKNTLKNLIKTLESKINTEIEKSEGNTTSKLQKELESATDKINSVLGNSYVVYDGSQILVLDRLPKEDAVNVMRINAGGIGFSQSGINGTFTSAWTLDGTFDAQQINAINITGDLIKGGTLKLGSNLDDAGHLEVYNESNTMICEIDKDGIEVFCDNGSTVKINNLEGLVGYNPDGERFYQGYEDEFTMTKANVSEEFTISDRIRMIPISTDSNTGIGVVAMV
jgi:phage minor structural protein